MSRRSVRTVVLSGSPALMVVSSVNHPISLMDPTFALRFFAACMARSTFSLRQQKPSTEVPCMLRFLAHAAPHYADVQESNAENLRVVLYYTYYHSPFTA
jgi:hypothetical protein